MVVLRKQAVIAFMFILGSAGAALAQDSVDLKWKFEKGKTFYQVMTTETKQDMVIQNNNVSQNQNQTFYMSFTPEQEDKDKNWIVRQKIEAVKMDIMIGGNPFKFDSTQESAASPLSEFFKALVGGEFRITISPTMKVIKVEGRDEFVKKLMAANPQMQPLLNQILSDEALKQMADPAFAVVPGKPVKKGDSWDRKSTLNMGPIGSYDTTYTYTYQGPEEKDKNLGAIKVATTLKYVPPAGAAGAQLPFQIVKADLASKESGGTILFDAAKGRLASAELTMKMEGSLTIAVGGTNQDVKLTQNQKTTLKTSDDNPLKKS
jgi:hypothetical protein